MGREMPESAIVLFTLIDTLIFLFFYANVHLIRVITHSSLETIPVFQHVQGMKAGFMDQRQFLTGSSRLKLLALLMLMTGKKRLGSKKQE